MNSKWFSLGALALLVTVGHAQSRYKIFPLTTAALSSFATDVTGNRIAGVITNHDGTVQHVTWGTPWYNHWTRYEYPPAVQSVQPHRMPPSLGHTVIGERNESAFSWQVPGRIGSYVYDNSEHNHLMEITSSGPERNLHVTSFVRGAAPTGVGTITGTNGSRCQPYWFERVYLGYRAHRIDDTWGFAAETHAMDERYRIVGEVFLNNQKWVACRWDRHFNPIGVPSYYTYRMSLMPAAQNYPESRVASMQNSIAVGHVRIDPNSASTVATLWAPDWDNRTLAFAGFDYANSTRAIAINNRRDVLMERRNNTTGAIDSFVMFGLNWQWHHLPALLNNPAGWSNLKATAISRDGTYIVGAGNYNGRYFGFVAWRQ